MVRRGTTPDAAGAAGDNAYDTDVLIVGAGPTGLALARELHTLGVAAQIVDRSPDAVHESRALAIQARTLEVLGRNGLADDLVSAGNPTGTLVLHDHRSAATGRTASIPLFDPGLGDTRFPFLLFLSQAGTERVLVDRLASAGVGIRRGLTLSGLEQDARGVTATLDSPGVRPRIVRARYVVGCDGAHSRTRHLAGIGFSGTAYPHRFLLADVEVDGLERNRVHVYLGADGPLLLFPLGTPATWRLLTVLPRSAPRVPVTLPVVQAALARHTRERLVVRHPVWLTEFTVSSRLADSFRHDRVFLAGDAAHIHSPAGGQGMNTGIQDAVNLGWKLAMVCHGEADATLLGSYEKERMPVARSVVRATDRAFRAATARVPVVRTLRARLVPRLGALVLRNTALRRAGFRVLSELSVHYRRSPLAVQGRPVPTSGPRPGERFPKPGMGADSTPIPAPATVPAPQHPPVFRMLLCGQAAHWSAAHVREFSAEWAHLVAVERRPDVPASRWSATPSAAAVSHKTGAAQYLVRWDGYVAYRAGGTDLAGAIAYLHSLGARPLTRRPDAPSGVSA